MKQWVKWKPVHGAELARIGSSVEAAWQVFAETWFPVHRPAQISIQVSSDRESLANPVDIHWTVAEALEVHASRSCLAKLSERVLGSPASLSGASPRTAAIVEAFQHRLLKDLARETYQQLYGSGAPFDDMDLRQIESVGPGHRARAFVSLSIERQLILSIRVVRPVSTDTTTPFWRRPLEKLVDAVDSVTVRGEVVVGTAQTTARELANATVGDVLLLEELLDRNLELQLDPGGVRLSGAIGHKGGAAALKLTLH